MYIRLFVKLTSRAWAMPILSSLHSGIPGRQAPLLAATGASRTAFAQSMAHLIEIGLMERNPGHGHPLRPEFRLTAQGIAAAALAAKIQQASESEDQTLLRRSWTLPVLTSLHQSGHFNEIRRTLPGITDRALSQALKAMEDKGWVQRDVDNAARPPRSIYRAIGFGAELSRITAAEIEFEPGE